MKAKKIALLGDTILDRYIHCKGTKLNPESAVPLVIQSHIETKLGGAANVYENLKSLDVNCEFFTVSANPSVKTRILHNNQTLLRVDDDQQADNEALIRSIKHTDFSQYDWIVISDYNKGALYPIDTVMNLLKPYWSKVIVDPKVPLKHYAGAFAIKPNIKEFEQSVGLLNEQSLAHFAKTNNHKLVIVTLGERGFVYYWNGDVIFKASECKNPKDVVGAGDGFLVGMLYALCHDKSVPQSLNLGNFAAARCAENIGTYCLTAEDVKQTVVFTNGCFDILHKGHISLLEKSKKLGTKLVVGLNSDNSVKRLKGVNRPVNNQEVRKRQLESLGIADEIHIFDEDTPFNLIKTIAPDIITKGGDYDSDQVVGNELADVVILPLLAGYSTTKIIEKADRTKEIGLYLQ